MKAQRLLTYAAFAVTAVLVAGLAMNAAFASTAGKGPDKREEPRGGDPWKEYKPHDKKDGGSKDSHDSEIEDSYNKEKKIEDSYNTNKKKETENSYNTNKKTTTTTTTTRTDSHDLENKDSHPITATCTNTEKSPNSLDADQDGKKNKMGDGTQSTDAAQSNDCHVDASHSGSANCGSFGVVVIAQCQGNVEGPANNNAEANYEEEGGGAPYAMDHGSAPRGLSTTGGSGGSGGLFGGLMSSVKGLLG